MLLVQLVIVVQQDHRGHRDHAVNPDKVERVSRDLKVLPDNPVATENAANLAETAREAEAVLQDEMVKMVQTAFPAKMDDLVQMAFLAKTFKLPMVDLVLKGLLVFPVFQDYLAKTV